MDHLRAVLSDATHFSLASHHEARDILQEYERDAALVAQLDEVSRFERGLAEQDSVISNDTDRVSMNARESANQSRAIARFELAEFTAIHQTRNDFMDIVSLAERCGEDAVQLVAGVDRFFGWSNVK